MSAVTEDHNRNRKISTLAILLAALALLLLAGWLDAFLLGQRKLAAASFEYTPMFWAQIGARLILVAAWFGLAWLVLIRLVLSRLGGLLLLAVGLFALLGAYLGMLAGLPIVRLRLHILATDFLSLTGAFIAVLGLLALMVKPAPGADLDRGMEAP